MTVISVNKELLTRVILYVGVGVWECGSVGVWECGSVGVWECRSVGV